jgi:ferrochelatase
MNLGSPDSFQVPDVRKYLHEFLMDEKVIDYPYIFRKLLVDGIIVRFRAPKSAHAYQSVWWPEGSPLIVLTRQLQQAVQPLMDGPVEIGMRYGNPSMKAAYDALLQKNPGIKKVVVYPLYPHYAMSSYETAYVHAEQVYKKGDYPFELRIVKPVFDDEIYINALADSMRSYMEQEYDKIIFSYHGVPERHIFKGDCTGTHCLKAADCCNAASKAHEFCYRHQVTRTTQLVAEKLGIPEDKYELTFQSRLGREKWLTPYTAQRMSELPGEGTKKILIVCPAFVSDCLETLEEIAVENKDIFTGAGGEAFTMIPCLNTHESWVKAVAHYFTHIDAYTLQPRA